jgi:alpha-L-fucosidase 2
MTAAIAELLLQSNDGEIRFLPALPGSWNAGEAKGLRARGGFEVDFSWDSGRLRKATILSQVGKPCRIRTEESLVVRHGGDLVSNTRPKDGVIEFRTTPGQRYSLVRVE